MKRITAILLLLLPVLAGHAVLPFGHDCNCPAVSQVTRTGKTVNSISWAWSGPNDATGYEVWYYRSEGAFTSARYTVYGTAHTFTGLCPGHYTFYFETICDGEASSIIGMEDVIID